MARDKVAIPRLFNLTYIPMCSGSMMYVSKLDIEKERRNLAKRSFIYPGEHSSFIGE